MSYLQRISHYIETYINKNYLGVSKSNYLVNIEAIVKNILKEIK